MGRSPMLGKPSFVDTCFTRNASRITARLQASQNRRRALTSALSQSSSGLKASPKTLPQMRNPQIQAAFQMGLWQLSKMRRTCSSEQLPDPSVSHLLGFLLLGIQHARNATCTECEPFLNMHRFNMGVVLKTWKSNLACMTRVWQRLPRTFCRKRNSISYNIVKAMFDQSS